MNDSALLALMASTANAALVAFAAWQLSKLRKSLAALLDEARAETGRQRERWRTTARTRHDD